MPEGQPVGAEAFEIVGVKVEFAAGSRYSASLDPTMLSLVAASPKQNVAPTAEFGKAYKADPLLTTKRDERDRGWVFFKVDKGTTSALRLAFNRPAYAVSTTDKSDPGQDLLRRPDEVGAPLTRKAPVPNGTGASSAARVRARRQSCSPTMTGSLTRRDTEGVAHPVAHLPGEGEDVGASSRRPGW